MCWHHLPKRGPVSGRQPTDRRCLQTPLSTERRPIVDRSATTSRTGPPPGSTENIYRMCAGRRAICSTANGQAVRTADDAFPPHSRDADGLERVTPIPDPRWRLKAVAEALACIRAERRQKELGSGFSRALSWCSWTARTGATRSCPSGRPTSGGAVRPKQYGGVIAMGARTARRRRSGEAVFPLGKLAEGAAADEAGWGMPRRREHRAHRTRSGTRRGRTSIPSVSCSRK